MAVSVQIPLPGTVPMLPGKPCRKWHGDYFEGCRTCILALTSAEHALLWGEQWPAILPPGPQDALQARRRVRIDPSLLIRGQADAAFNASLVRFQGRLLLAYRTSWEGAQVHVCELTGPDMIPGPSTTLNLTHERANFGREDPRWFVFRGRLHIEYIGVEGSNGPTSVLYARLRDDLTVEKIFYPFYQGRASWEKSWGMFESAGELFAVHSIKPHRVLHIVGEKAYPFAEHPGLFDWSGGERRGGASPVLVGDRFVSWFHGCADVLGRRRYNVGVYEFEPKPPFRPLRMTPHPLVWADPRECPDPVGIWADVVFPCGAIYDHVQKKWLISAGYMDRYVELYEWDDQDVRMQMKGSTVKHALPCRHLGKMIHRGACGSCHRTYTHQCQLGCGEVRPESECEDCPAYEEE